MFKPTTNVYRFQYLITTLRGEGIKEVYLPEIPDKSQILFGDEKKWVRPEPHDDLKKWIKEYYVRSVDNPSYVHPHQHEIDEYEDIEWKRCREGVFIYNGYDDPGKEPEIIYLTGFHYWFLTYWIPYFGRPDFRDPDREVFYFIQYCEEDPRCYGILLNTIRRFGKSTVMGAWIVYRATMNKSHNAGMMGQTKPKISKFYKKSVLKPFYKLPRFLQPTFNEDTRQSNQIEFDLSQRQKEKHEAAYGEEIDTLESMIDFRATNEFEYDGDILGSFLIEEPGKIEEASLYDDDGEGIWDVTKPCFTDGDVIIGKAFLGTTVENLKMVGRAGAAYKKLADDSDFNEKQADGCTKSGLYFSFLPGDCAYKGYYDNHGRPRRHEAKLALLRKRESFKNNPRKRAGEIRKYPLTIQEIFYVSPEHCHFNADAIQAQISRIDSSHAPFTEKGELKWENGIKFSKAVWTHNSQGWLEVSKLLQPNEANQVEKKTISGVEHRSPRNGHKNVSGCDPIQHRSAGKGRESKPVLYVKSKYDPQLDGVYPTVEELELRAQPGKLVDDKWVLDPTGSPYPYKSNRYFMQMRMRPMDPNVLYERWLLMLWYCGCPANVEKQFGGGFMSWLWANHCEDFIQNKWKPEFEKPDATPQEGTSQSKSTIEFGFDKIATYVEYFCHLIPFKEQLHDLLIADPSEMTEHDETSAMIHTEISEEIKPKHVPKPVLNLDEYVGKPMPTWGSY